MRTALFLLLLLAIAAVPGSLCRSAAPTRTASRSTSASTPDVAPVLDKLQRSTSTRRSWFSAIYLLLFVSLIGCIIPRTAHH